MTCLKWVTQERRLLPHLEVSKVLAVKTPGSILSWDWGPIICFHVLVSTKRLVVSFKGTVLCSTRSLADVLVSWYGAHQQLILNATTSNLRNVLFQCTCAVWTQILSLEAWRYHRRDSPRKEPPPPPLFFCIFFSRITYSEELQRYQCQKKTSWYCYCKQSSRESTCYHWAETGSTLMSVNKEGEFLRVWMGYGKSKEQSQESTTVRKISG